MPMPKNKLFKRVICSVVKVPFRITNSLQIRHVDMMQIHRETLFQIQGVFAAIVLFGTLSLEIRMKPPEELATLFLKEALLTA